MPVEHRAYASEPLIDRDEHPRPDTTLEALARLSHAVSRQRHDHRGQRLGVNDGAARCCWLRAARAAVIG
ncbi:MAG: hypothetical protein IPF57_11830 [Gammaproteobacteria bacterium]|nr:hypothetical protein [Gammaproteobacteria bacterium]